MIESFATGTYPLKRPIADGAYIDGVYQPSATETVEVVGSLQPLSAKESLLLPENERNRESFNLFTEVELFPASEDGIRQADIVLLNGEEFAVRSVLRWRNVDLPYFKSLLQRVNDQEGSP
ncbi:MAG: hypothetical protein IPK68_09010 [Bdellovibrionales bacterium]|nr:hypothetical protein [Bdellovibrionales bacterium]